VVDEKLPALDAFHAVSIMTVNIWYPESNLVPPGIGYLIPRSCPEELNPERALGVFFDSNLLVEQTAKEGGTKVYVLFGGHYYDSMPAPSETEAVEQAKALLERHIGIPRDTPCHAEAALRKECLPQHHVGHFTRISEANQQLEDTYGGRLAAVGGSFSRPGVMGALRAGHDIARSMARENFLATGLESLQDSRVRDPLYPLSGPRALLQYSEHVHGRPVE
jgi:protoporphyrinogen/coproporphyrinogen III oxidase